MTGVVKIRLSLVIKFALTKPGTAHSCISPLEYLVSVVETKLRFGIACIHVGVRPRTDAAPSGALLP